MTEWLSQGAQWLSVWHTTRAAGLTAFVLLSLAVSAGILQSMRILPDRWREGVGAIHRGAGWVGLLFGLAHGLVLLFDEYVGYSLADILIPFHSARQTGTLAAGILSLYGLLVLQFTVDWLRKVGAVVWKTVHWLAFPAYLMGLWHGVAMGSDTGNPLVAAVYLVSLGTVALLLLIRAALLFFSPGRIPAAPPSGGR